MDLVSFFIAILFSTRPLHHTGILLLSLLFFYKKKTFLQKEKVKVEKFIPRLSEHYKTEHSPFGIHLTLPLSKRAESATESHRDQNTEPRSQRKALHERTMREEQK